MCTSHRLGERLQFTANDMFYKRSEDKTVILKQLLNIDK